MSIRRCNAGLHTYDDAQHSTCPYCRKTRLFRSQMDNVTYNKLEKGFNLESRYLLDLKFYETDRSELWLARDLKLSIKVVIKFVESQNKYIKIIEDIKSKNLVKIY